MERAMGIEPSSYSLDVVEITSDKYDDRPKPSNSAEVAEANAKSLPGLVTVISYL
jgi:hypothetical protein